METKMKKSQDIVALQPNELTMFQQIAVEGEIAMLYSNCSKAEIACRTFEKLAGIDKKYVEIYKNVMLNYVDIDLIELCLYHVNTETIPVYLYANRYSEELMSLLGHDMGSMRVMGYPLEAVKSKFVQAMRVLVKYLPITGVAILDQITDKISKSKSDLDFLLPVIFSLKSGVRITEADIKFGGKVNPEDSIKFFIKIKLLMDTTIGQMSIMLLSNEIKNKSKSNLLDMVLSYNEEYDEDLTDEDEKGDSLEEVLENLVKSKAYSEESDEEETETSLVYIVKKIDSATGKTVMTWDFKTQAEAVAFVQDTHANYPEVTKRFHFMVELTEE